LDFPLLPITLPKAIVKLVGVSATPGIWCAQVKQPESTIDVSVSRQTILQTWLPCWGTVVTRAAAVQLRFKHLRIPPKKQTTVLQTRLGGIVAPGRLWGKALSKHLEKSSCQPEMCSLHRNVLWGTPTSSEWHGSMSLRPHGTSSRQGVRFRKSCGILGKTSWQDVSTTQAPTFKHGALEGYTMAEQRCRIRAPRTTRHQLEYTRLSHSTACSKMM